MAKNGNQQKDTGEAMKNVGKRLAYLVFLAPITEEAKEEIIKTLPFMSLEQIDQTATLLEKSIKTSTGDPKKDELIAELDALADKYNAKKAAINNKAMSEMDKIEADL